MMEGSMLMAYLLVVVAPFAVVAAPCTLCEDGTPPSLPDFVVDLPPLVKSTCAEIDIFLPLLIPDETSDVCTSARKVGPSLCGCPIRSDACQLCPDGSSVVHKSLELPEFPPLTEETIFTCELLEAYMLTFSESGNDCGSSRLRAAEKCGCPEFSTDSTNSSTLVDSNSSTVGGLNGQDTGAPLVSGTSFGLYLTFLGSTDYGDLRWLYAILRTGAALSLVGALLVIQDTLRSARRRKCLYNQIVALMAAFDIVYTIAVALINIPRPTDTSFQVPEQQGNHATCKAQGWFIQWGGMTSLFLNASLSTYYILVIVYNRRAARLKSISKWFLGVPMVAGFVVACASIPFISSSVMGCHIPPPSSAVHQKLEFEGSSSSWGPYLGLYIVPAFAVIFYTTGALLRVYLYVSKINRKASRWRFPKFSQSDPSATQQEGSSSWNTRVGHGLSRRRKPAAPGAAVNLQKELAIQSAMYLVALYLCWFVYLLLAVCLEKYLLSHYSLWCFVYFLFPLQGFLNSITYFRPRFVRLWAKYRKNRKKRKQQQASTNSSSDDIKIDGEENADWAANEPAADMESMIPLEETNSSTEVENSGIFTNPEEIQNPPTASCLVNGGHS